jgi:nucleoside-diphosphate-sugar epimerase
MTEKTFLITGGSGFLGCHLALELLRRGSKVKIIDPAPCDEPGIKNAVEYLAGDVRDIEKLKKGMQGVDVVIHAAAALPLASRNDIFSTNVTGTRHVLKAAEEKGVPRVVFISSTAVYGVPKKHPILEDDPKIGVGPYGQSKILAEQIVHQFRQKKMVTPIIRPKTFIGTGRLGVFQILFDWVSRGARIPIIGKGRNRYQLLDVSDLVSAILLAAEGSADQVNQDFNVGAKRFATVAEDVGSLCEAAQSGSRVLRTPARPVKAVLKLLEKMRLSPLYQWVYDTADKDSFVSTERIEKNLGWKPKYSNAESLIRTYEWYREFMPQYQMMYGTTHRVAWKQGALAIARKILGG